MEALAGLDAEIVECAANPEAFIAAARDADAVYAKGMKFDAQMIQALQKCRLIALGSVGVDYVDVGAATEKGIPVTNCPDTFIEEVADHAMMLLLATHRRAIEQDRMVREGRWAEGRPQLLKVPRLLGQTLGFIAFGRVARAARRQAFSLPSSPTIRSSASGLSRRGTRPPLEVLVSDFIHAHAGDARGAAFSKEHFQR
jgi:D-3-phosphoglycerate dehydrogenase